MERTVVGVLTGAALGIAALCVGACGGEAPVATSADVDAAPVATLEGLDAASVVGAAALPLRAPDPATIPDDELGDAIRRGRELALHTNQLLPDHVGGGLTCSSCHRGAGTVPHAGPWVGVVGQYPQYRARSGGVDTLEQRVNDCFERSMNGVPIDPDGEDMTSLVAYMTWLSQDVPVGAVVDGRGFARMPAPAETPDAARGAALYQTRCAACHGADGQGVVGADGAVAFPPLWGPRSFNVGAGMARLDTAAAFVHDNMPLGQGGSLTPAEAYDLAAFFTTQPRPDFSRKASDWPKGGKPRDARY